jgi:hypothetical protein
MPSNSRSKLPVATVAGRGAKKGSSTQKAKTPRSTARYMDLKIRLLIEEYNRGLPYFENQKHLAKFVLDAYKEKINRAESNDKAGRLRVLANNIELLLPVITEMHKQGKLDFLSMQGVDISSDINREGT